MLEIIHTPLGHEHPYTQQPEERSPREPLAGEPFTIGVLNPQHKGATGMPCIQPIEQCRAGTADVKKSRWTGGKPDSN